MSDLEKKAVRSIAVTLSAQAAKFAIGLVVTVILARLLTPEEYGLVAMVTVFTGFLAIFRDGGLSIVTVQRANITEAQISTLYWINVALGMAMAVIVVLMSPLVGWFYNDESLVWITVALAVPFILTGVSAQHQALMQREMRFKAIAFIEIASLIISASAGVFAAAFGWGYWALVTMSIISVVVNTVLLYCFCSWRPGRPSRGIGVRSMLKFGGELTAVKLFDGIASSLDSLLIGRVFSAEMVGYYTRAQNLMLLPLSQVMPPLLSVALPVMSRLAKNSENLKRLFLDALQFTAIVSSFVTIFLVVGADWLVRVLLGSQWLEASEILRLLAGPALFIPLSTVCVASLTALGSGSILVGWSLVKNVIIIIAILTGVAWGGKGVALALSIASIFVLMPILYTITAKTGLASFGEIWGACGVGIGSCFFECVLLFLMKDRFVTQNALMSLLILFFIGGFCHLLIVCAFPRSRGALVRSLNVALASRE